MKQRSSAVRRLRMALSLAGFLVAWAAWAAPVTVVVTSTADTLTSCASLGTGECTLRDAITYSNAHFQPFLLSNLIQFNIPGSGVQTIELTSNLPTITTAVVIDGYSQPGASPNTLAVGDNAVLLVLIKGAKGADIQGLNDIFKIDDGTGTAFSGRTVGGSLIRGLVLSSENVGGANGIDSIVILSSCCNRIEGNFIGVDPTGTAATPARPDLVDFVNVLSAANVVGGSTPSARNVIASEQTSVNLGRTVNHVQGNYIGTNASGTKAVSGGVGIKVSGQGNTIGGSTAADRNLISGHVDGVLMSGSGNLVVSNYIGTDATGLLPIPNDIGVWIYGNAAGNSVGLFSSPGTGNLIAFNSTGVLVSEAPGLDVPGARRNQILYNSIHSNTKIPDCCGGPGAKLGIDLGIAQEGAPILTGVTPNDPCDGDVGPNLLQNYPELTSAVARTSTTEIEGTLDSQPNKEYLVQLFANSACNPSGFGEGETFIDELFVTTDNSCNASFKDIVPLTSAPLGSFITATATDLDGNTSEFSACLEVRLRGIRTLPRFLVEGPIRVAPGVPVQLRFKVDTEPPGRIGDFSGDAIVSDDQGDSCRTFVSPEGEGVCELTLSTSGHYLVRAQYLGNATFEESVSPPIPVLVGSR